MEWRKRREERERIRDEMFYGGRWYHAARNIHLKVGFPHRLRHYFNCEGVYGDSVSHKHTHADEEPQKMPGGQQKLHCVTDFKESP